MFTDIIVLFSLVVVPDRDCEALLGKVHNVCHEHELNTHCGDTTTTGNLPYLLIELRVRGAPLDGGLVPGVRPRPGLRQHHAADNSQCYTTRDTSYTRDPSYTSDACDPRDSLHSDEGVRLVAVRVGGGEAAAAEDADLEGAVLGVEGEAELHLAAVVRHDQAVLAILPTFNIILSSACNNPPFIFICSAVISFHQQGSH